MYHSIKFYNGTTYKDAYKDWGLVPETRPLVVPPEPKTKYLEIPGANGQLDLSEILTGYPVFNNREGEWTFYVLNDYPLESSSLNERNLVLDTSMARTSGGAQSYTTGVSPYMFSDYGRMLYYGNTTDYITVSFQYSTTGASSGNGSSVVIQPQLNSSINGLPPKNVSTADSTGRYVSSFRLNSSQANSSYNPFRLIIKLNNVANGAKLTVSDCKVEYGNTATSWKKAPEDPHTEPWQERYTSIMSYLQGKRLKAVLDDDPEYYYVGRFYLSEWSSEETYSKVTISYNVEPYKKTCYETTSGSATYLVDTGGSSL